jgi:hypothetical protein
MMPSYADRSRQRFAAKLAQPRNLKAADQARSEGCALVVSFVGDTPWSNPTVYCDSGQRYDWRFLEGQHTPWGSFEGMHTIVAVRPGVITLDALPEILERMAGSEYPVLVDLHLQEVACIVDAVPPLKVQLWQTRRGSGLWQQYFTP